MVHEKHKSLEVCNPKNTARERRVTKPVSVAGSPFSTSRSLTGHGKAYVHFITSALLLQTPKLLVQIRNVPK
eukprot:4671391-Amphidinium_carterae.1